MARGASGSERSAGSRRALSGVAGAVILVAVIAVAGAACYVALGAVSHATTRTSSSETQNCVPANAPGCVGEIVVHSERPVRAVSSVLVSS
jgi:flagellin-like protein